MIAPEILAGEPEGRCHNRNRARMPYRGTFWMNERVFGTAAPARVNHVGVQTCDDAVFFERLQSNGLNKDGPRRWPPLKFD